MPSHQLRPDPSRQPVENVLISKMRSIFLDHPYCIDKQKPLVAVLTNNLSTNGANCHPNGSHLAVTRYSGGYKWRGIVLTIWSMRLPSTSLFRVSAVALVAAAQRQWFQPPTANPQTRRHTVATQAGISHTLHSQRLNIGILRLAHPPSFPSWTRDFIGEKIFLFPIESSNKPKTRRFTVPHAPRSGNLKQTRGPMALNHCTEAGTTSSNRQWVNPGSRRPRQLQRRDNQQKLVTSRRRQLIQI